MLKVLSCQGGEARPIATTGEREGHLQPGALWIDIVGPDKGDVAFIKRETGLDLPSLEQLSEVESSSRLRSLEGAFYLSMPMLKVESGYARMVPVGLILTAERFVSVRFEEMDTFDRFAQAIVAGENSHPTAPGTFVALLEAIVDGLADTLEEVGTHIDEIVETVFGEAGNSGRSAHKKSQDRRLRATLQKVGRQRQLISKVRGTLLGVGRILPYVAGEGEDWLPEGTKPRLESLGKDVDSLDQYEEHLSDKIQFLLDAALGLINIEQNDTFRVLTLVSVVGIPPTLVASMYGMNFKHMPELDWIYGYPYGLALIALSIVVPLVYFRRKGWF